MQIDTVHIQNATVTSNPQNQYKLLQYRMLRLLPVIKQGYTEIDMERKSPNDELTITIATKPNLKYPIITIPKFVQNECRTVKYEPSNGVQQFTFPFDTTSDPTWNPGRKYVGEFRQLWVVHHDLDQIPDAKGDASAVVESVQCSRVGVGLDAGFFDFDHVPPATWTAPGGGRDTRVGYCSGWWQEQNPGRRIETTISWNRSQRTCDEITWPTK